MNYYLTQAGVKLIIERGEVKTRNKAKKNIWRIPDPKKRATKKKVEDEGGEFKRVAGGDKKKTGKEMAAARGGTETTTKDVKGVGNTEAADIKPGLAGLLKSMRILKKDKRDKARRRNVYTQVKSGTQDPSIVRTTGTGKSKKSELVAGNTRAMMSRALGKPIKVRTYKSTLPIK